MKWRSKARVFFAFLEKSLENYPIIFVFCLSLFENLVIESLGRHSFLKGLFHMITSPGVFFYNSIIIMLTLSIALLFRRRVFMLVLLTVPWLGCAIANCVLLAYRITPLSAIDFQIMKLSLILIYLQLWQAILLCIAIVLFVVSMVVLWMSAPKVKEKISYGKSASVIASVAAVAVVLTFLMQGVFSVGSDFTNMARAYEDYGFAYSFSSSLFVKGMDEPEHYGELRIHKILADLPETNDTTRALKPDIILIQMESFIDPKTLNGVTFSQDPAPTYTFLRENYSSGQMVVPSFGGGTANTEFEILTGINLDKFGPGEYPYKTVLQEETCETIAYNLGELGYSAHAIHNHTSDFYDRDLVYSRMGFDSFQSIEYMSGYEITSYGWCKDKALTKEITAALDHTDEKRGIKKETPRFVWAVSVQGHGAYPTAPIEGLTNTIKITSDKYDQHELCAMEYYVNQVWEMDSFLGDLVSVLKTRSRPTLLIVYGDHMPSLSITAEDVDTGNLFTTEYVTWNNFDLEKADKNLRTYELSAQIMGWLGFNNGNITKLHQSVSAKNSDISEEDYQERMAIIAYDMLYGENLQFGGKKPYKELDMQMGTLPITVESVKIQDGRMYVYGNGFTMASAIFVGDDDRETVFVDEHTLMTEDVTIEGRNTVKVGQMGSLGKVLGYSNSITYK